MALNEQDIKKIAEEALKQLGHSASPEAVEQVVRETVSRLQEGGPSEPVKEWKNVQSGQKPASTERIIITAFGKNRVGILAKMTEALAKNNCDILDLTQKLMQDFFTIMLLVDISNSPHSFEQIKNDLIQTGEALDLKVIVQHEEIFNAMHRI
ncbi:MAG: ACT domain-containing protein [Caldisericaceae bacterium]|nr:ACT domain-containing protein [Caldisericaceae bacterium]